MYAGGGESRAGIRARPASNDPQCHRTGTDVLLHSSRLQRTPTTAPDQQLLLLPVWRHWPRRRERHGDGLSRRWSCSSVPRQRQRWRLAHGYSARPVSGRLAASPAAERSKTKTGRSRALSHVPAWSSSPTRHSPRPAPEYQTRHVTAGRRAPGDQLLALTAERRRRQSQ